MIIEQHNSIRNSKKEEIQSHYEFEKDDLECQKEQAEFDRQMEREDRESLKDWKGNLIGKKEQTIILSKARLHHILQIIISQNPWFHQAYSYCCSHISLFEEAVFNSLSYEKERSAPRL